MLTISHVNIVIEWGLLCLQEDKKSFIFPTVVKFAILEDMDIFVSSSQICQYLWMFTHLNSLNMQKPFPKNWDFVGVSRCRYAIAEDKIVALLHTFY